MNQDMFYFQCEQSAGCGGCTRAGVCGKSAVTAKAQDDLTGALIGLSRTAIAADCLAEASDAILPF